MPNIQEIVSNVTLLLDKRISIDEFGDWMAVRTAKIIFDGNSDKATGQLARTIQSHVTNFDTGEINEEKLRQELAKAIQPFLPLKS